MKKIKVKSEENILYANVLEKGMFFGLILMVVTFFLYIFGLLDPVIPLKRVNFYWNQPVNEYLLQINSNFLDWEELPIGWSWLKLIWYGDFLNFLPIAILSGIAPSILHTPDMLPSNSNNDVLQHQIAILYIF